jgi:hypothetical protein
MTTKQTKPTIALAFSSPSAALANPHVLISVQRADSVPSAADAPPPAKPTQRFSSKALVRPVLDDGEDTDEYDEDEDDAVW